jgi:hypothetical protein
LFAHVTGDHLNDMIEQEINGLKVRIRVENVYEQVQVFGSEKFANEPEL